MPCVHRVDIKHLSCCHVQVIRVSSNLGWSFELAIRAASDVALHDKYNMAGFLQVGSLPALAATVWQYSDCTACGLHSMSNCC